MRIPRIETSLVLGFVVVLALFIANGVVFLRNIRTIDDNARLVVHTGDVLNASEQTLTALIDAETGQRGFLLTGDERYLQPHYAGADRAGKLMTQLENLTRDNPSQQSRLIRLRQVSNEKLTELKATIDLGKAGQPDEALRIVKTDIGRQFMVDIRALIGEIKDEEQRLLADRQRSAIAASNGAVFTLILASGMGIAFLMTAFFLIFGDTRRRIRVEEELRRGRDALEATVLERTASLKKVNDDLVTEIAERRRAEEELQTYSRRLLRSNRELQEFASVASHDLQEPLRKIQAFGDRLQVKCADSLGEQGRSYLEPMLAAAGRMRSLINDLLTFSRISTKAQPFEKIDLQRVAGEVASDLEGRIEETGASVEFDGLPVLDADAMQMRQLLQNLIANAIKFHRPDVRPVVRVSGRVRPSRVVKIGDPSEPGSCEIAVQDNGIGFDEKYLDRIFNVFQRLHGRGEYEGTGMGLAICRKIVERHGGTITAKSEAGTGSRFIIELPIEQVCGRDIP
jgi:signal transduction histidine kinase